MHRQNVSEDSPENRGGAIYFHGRWCACNAGITVGEFSFQAWNNVNRGPKPRSLFDLSSLSKYLLEASIPYGVVRLRSMTLHVVVIHRGLIMTHVIRKSTLGEAWNESLKLFLKAKQLNRYDSMRGPCLEIEDVIFEVSNPARSPRVSHLFPAPFHALVDDFTEKLTSRHISRFSATNDRLYQWLRRDGTKLDQMAKLIEMLRVQPESRYSILGFWDPDIDLFSEKPISSLVAYVRIRDDKLQSTVVARTIDAWLGAVPLLVGFANLQISVAQSVNVPVGTLKLIALSYHMYEMDLPVVMAKLGGSP